MEGTGLLLAALIALLVGLATGKAWERYKLQDGRWIDRRRAGESPHYMLGLNFLVANQIDPAIDELTRAAQAAGDPLEIHLMRDLAGFDPHGAVDRVELCLDRCRRRGLGSWRR